MKKIHIIICAIAALALTSACNLKTEFPELVGDESITLGLQYSEPGTKAEPSKEDVINSVDYFFYTDTTKAPDFSFRDDNPASKISEGKYTINVKAGQVIAEGKVVPKLSKLFANGKFELYAVFNSPEAITPANLTTVKQTAVALSFAHQETNADGKQEWAVTSDDDEHHDKYFVMTGQKTVNKANGGNYANEVTNDANVVEMKRLAAKVSAKINILKSKTLTDETTWEPMLGAENVRLYLCNFVQNTLMGAASEEPVLPTSYTQADYKVYALDTENPEESEDGDYYVVESQQDFYTYPIAWTAGSDDEPYLKLIIPWKENDGTVPNKELYYKIMFPSDITSIEANKFYQLEVTVDLQGNEGEPVITIKGYRAQVVGWKENSKVSSAVSDAKYLSVEKESIKFFTQNSGITFAASDNVYLVINNVYQKNLSTDKNEYVVEDGDLKTQRTDLGTPTWITDNGQDDGNIIGLQVGTGEGSEWIILSNTENYLQVGHPLDAVLTSEHMDVTPWVYEITMKLVGVDGTAYDRDVTFEQWPNMYIIEDMNSNGDDGGNAGVYVNGFQGGSQYNSGHSTHRYDGVTIRQGTNPPRYQENEDAFDLGTVSGITSSAGNKNPRMYVITVSVSDNKNIGDPRTAEVDNFDDFVKVSGERHTQYSWSGSYYYWLETEPNWVSAPALGETNNRTLKNYHPTSSDASFKTMIAPKIRIASSYGVTSQLFSREEAQLRCAGYQEDGLPAGRWRVPTLAEVQLICSMSTLNRIPYLFGYIQGSTSYGQNAYYWTASGQIVVENSAGKFDEVAQNQQNSTASVRCVYDEWFWGDTTSSNRPATKTTFTWGDRNY